MSLEYLNAALHLPMDDPACKAVLIGLANHTDADGQCWPGLRRLMLYSSYSERTVRDALRRLERMGLLETQRRPQQTSIYHLRLEVGRELPQPRQEPPQGGAPAAPEPLLNPKEPDASADARAFEDWEPGEKAKELIRKAEGLSDAEIQRELVLFRLKCMAHKIPTRPEPAFRAWCARVKTLNHTPKPPPPSPAKGGTASPMTLDELNAQLVEQGRHDVHWIRRDGAFVMEFKPKGEQK